MVKGSTPCVLTRGSWPEVTTVSYEEYQRCGELQEQEAVARFDALTERVATQNAAFTDDAVAEDVKAAGAEIRA